MSFPFHVRLATYPRPKAGFLTLEDAREYATWASAKLTHHALLVTNEMGVPLYTMIGGRTVDATDQ